ncbi:MAG: FapA family protein, partial [Chloroflexota bacterium]
GAILDGFKVVSTGEVMIGGPVDGAEVRAGGAIHVNGGVIGRNQARLVAGEGVAAKFVSGATIVADGDVRVGSEILHSNVYSKGKVVVAGSGRITGGRVVAAGGVEANVLGSSSDERTWVEVPLPGGFVPGPEGPWIDVKAECWPRVFVKIGDASLRVRDALAEARFMREGLAIAVVALPKAGGREAAD